MTILVFYKKSGAFHFDEKFIWEIMNLMLVNLVNVYLTFFLWTLLKSMKKQTGFFTVQRAVNL